MMEAITITQNGFDGMYMSYLYGKVKERFSFLPSTCDLERKGDCSRLQFTTEREYCPYVRKFAEEHISDVIAIGYKYEYFNRRLPLPMLSKSLRRVLLTALVAADYPEDRAFIAKRLRGFSQYCLDGVFHFRLQELKKRWDGIVDYIPTEMNESATDGFLEFLVEDGEGKLYVKSGKVYDSDYRPLSRSLLTGVESVVGEIILGGAERVYCFGETDGETRTFLKKYYGKKGVFC